MIQYSYSYEVQSRTCRLGDYAIGGMDDEEIVTQNDDERVDSPT